MQSINGRPVTVILPEEVVKFLDGLSAEFGLKRSRVIRIMITQGIMSHMADTGEIMGMDDWELKELFKKLDKD